jgi:hypothetical protein
VGALALMPAETLEIEARAIDSCLVGSPREVGVIRHEGEAEACGAAAIAQSGQGSSGLSCGKRQLSGSSWENGVEK